MSKGKVFRRIGYLVLLFAVSIIVWNCEIFKTHGLVGNKYIVSFIGVILGFALTIYTFIISLVEKLQDKLPFKTKGKLANIHSEVGNEIILLLVCFLMSLVLVSIDKHALQNSTLLNFNLYNIVGVLNLYTLVLSVVALTDITITSLNLSSIVGMSSDK